jgi:hypothetical protein
MTSDYGKAKRGALSANFADTDLMPALRGFFLRA